MSVGVEVDSKEAIAAIDRKIFGIVKAVKGAAIITGEVMASDLRQRLVLPRRVNVQDAENAKVRRNPVQIKTATEYVDVVLQPFWTSSRSKAVFSVLNRSGKARELQRDGLWVGPPNMRGKGGYSSRSGLKYFAFSDEPKLLVWAQRSDRGRQMYRHAIWLDDVEGRKVLQMLPVVRKRTPDLANRVFEGVKNS